MEKTLYNRSETECLGVLVDQDKDVMVFEDNFKNQFEVPKNTLSAICNVSDISKPSFYYRIEYVQR